MIRKFSDLYQGCCYDGFRGKKNYTLKKKTIKRKTNEHTKQTKKAHYTVNRRSAWDSPCLKIRKWNMDVVGYTVLTGFTHMVFAAVTLFSFDNSCTLNTFKT